jgi:hypothetical protein
MLSAEAIVAQIQQGQIPTHWHIVKGRGSPLKTVLQTLAIYLLSGLIGASFYFATQGKISLPDPYVVGFSAIPGVMIPSFRAWRWVKEAQHSLLIMEPEGFMLLTHSNSRSKRRLVTYFYGSITSIDLKLRLNYFLRQPNYPALRMNICSSNSIHFWADLDTRFGPPLKIAQTIIVAHAQYLALHPYAG